MTLRDLGYRPYQGPRLPPSNSTWVMYRYGLRRALDSMLAKLLIVASFLPALAMAAYTGFVLRLQPSDDFRLAPIVGQLLTFETWTFVGTLALLSGSTAIAEDLQNKAFPFFFAKPLTPIQYLLGRVAAIATLLAVPLVGPATLVVLGVSAVAPSEVQLESLAAIFPAIAQSVLVALVCASVSVGLSAITKNRAITMSLWVVLWIVPKIISSIVRLASEHAWLDLTSVPALLGIVVDSLLGEPESGDLHVGYAAAALASIVALALVYATNRLERAEVVA